MIQARRLSLTPAHIAKVHRDIPDPGPTPGRVYLDDQDFRDLTNNLLGVPQASGDLWVFAFGSLMWKPACEVAEQRPALLKGWHRSFCMKLNRYRGTPECPGLMMALQRSGEVEGVIQRLPSQKKYEAVEQLLRRELSSKPPGQPPIWVKVESQGNEMHAFVFALRQDVPFYAGDLSADEKAEVLSKACGHWGSGAEYLMNTVQHLEEMGIHDPYLWDLQERVAKKIAERHGL